MERAPTYSLLCSSKFSHLWSCFFTGFWFSIHPMTANLSQSSPILQESSLHGSLRGHCWLGLHPRDSDLIGLGIGIFCFLDSPSDFLGAVKVESNSPRLFIHGVVASAPWLHLILHLAQNTQFITSLSCPTSGQPVLWSWTHLTVYSFLTFTVPQRVTAQPWISTTAHSWARISVKPTELPGSTSCLYLALSPLVGRTSSTPSPSYPHAGRITVTPTSHCES